jgi:hypothetical protein
MEYEPGIVLDGYWKNGLKHGPFHVWVDDELFSAVWKYGRLTDITEPSIPPAFPAN